MKRCDDIPEEVPILEAQKGHTYEHKNGDIYLATKIKDIEHLILISLLTGTPWSYDFTFGFHSRNAFIEVDCCFKKVK